MSYAAGILDSIRASRRPATILAYETLVSRIAPKLKSIRLKSLRAVHVQNALDALMGDGWSPTTARQGKAYIRMALQSAVNRNLIPVNVISGRGAIELPTPHRDVPEPWSLEDADMFLASLTATDEAIIALTIMLVEGTRVAETLALSWREIDLTRGTIAIRRQLGRNGAFGPTKSKAGQRVIPIFPPAHAALVRYRLATKGDGLLFSIKHRQLWEAFRTQCGRAGIRLVRPHDLRRAFASRLALRNVPARVAMQWGGWSSIAIVMDLYAAVGVTDTASLAAQVWPGLPAPKPQSNDRGEDAHTRGSDGVWRAL